MLKEERTIMNLEMAIKKEKYRSTQQTLTEPSQTTKNYNESTVTSPSAHKINSKKNTVNFLLGKIGF